ncbi:MAG TPA: LuxR C-terminal-related transcriptional regulator [Pilimelia sp.]|nr:LuxR C-terminal-related transcriptional regulator [Pilimelia sp.]
MRILDQMPESLREVARELSPLEQANADLVEALTGRTDGARTLVLFERCGLMVSHDRARPGWYAYRPPYGFLLYEELRRASPDRLVELHRRAADWYARRKVPAAELRHALAAQDWRRATHTMGSSWHELVTVGCPTSGPKVPPTPPPHVRHEPGLALAFASERLDAGDGSAGARFLRLAERAGLETATGTFRAVAAAVELRQAQAAGQSDVVLTTARRLLRDGGDGSPGTGPEGLRLRAIALVAAGGTELDHGDLGAAQAYLTEGVALARQAGMVRVQVSGLGSLAALQLERGRPGRAIAHCREAMARADGAGLTGYGDLAWIDLALAEAGQLQGRIDAAEHHLGRILEVDALAHPAFVVGTAVVHARIDSLTGDARMAGGVLAAVRDEFAGRRISPKLRQVATLTEAEIRLAGADPQAAERLLAQECLPRYTAWAAVVRAKTHLARRRVEAALRSIRPYLEPVGGSLVWAVEANLVAARILRALGRHTNAAAAMARALQLADDDDIRWPFLCGGADVRALLRSHAQSSRRWRALAEDVLAMLPSPRTPGRAESPVETLTERERSVLRLLQGTLTTEEIAATLYVSVNTVKTHMKAIYRKLGAGRRREVVARARLLNLL